MQICFSSSGYHLLLVLHLYLHHYGRVHPETVCYSAPRQTQESLFGNVPQWTGLTNGPEQSQNRPRQAVINNWSTLTIEQSLRLTYRRTITAAFIYARVRHAHQQLNQLPNTRFS